MANMAPPPQPSQPLEQTAWKEDLNLQLICRDCKEVPPNLVEEFASGDTVCGSCGLVLGERIVDTRSEWRTFSNDDQNTDDPSRVGDGPNELLDGEQLHTTIAFEAGGNAKSRDLHRAQNKAIHDKVSKTLLAAYKEIGALCDSRSIPQETTTAAKQLFKQVSDGNAVRTKSQETVIAGCIFIACRQTGWPRTFKEIFTLTKVSKAEIGRTFKTLEKFFQAENAKKKAKAEEAGGRDDSVAFVKTKSTDPKALCARFCNQLSLEYKNEVMSKEIVDRADKAGLLGGRSPLSIAAAAIYMASHLVGQPKNAKEISAVAAVSDGTIRNAYKLIYPKRELLIDPEWIASGKADNRLLPIA